MNPMSAADARPHAHRREQQRDDQEVDRGAPAEQRPERVVQEDEHRAEEHGANRRAPVHGRTRRSCRDERAPSYRRTRRRPDAARRITGAPGTHRARWNRRPRRLSRRAESRNDANGGVDRRATAQPLPPQAACLRQRVARRHDPLRRRVHCVRSSAHTLVSPDVARSGVSTMTDTDLRWIDRRPHEVRPRPRLRPS